MPSFINELSPTELKGPLGSITQILITVGIMISFFLGIFIPEFPLQNPDDKTSFYVLHYWKVMFSIPIAISLIQSSLIFSVFNYDTPKYLKQHNKVSQLNELMGRIYDHSFIQERIDAITIDEGQQTQSPTYKEVFFHPRYRLATFYGCMLSLF